MVVGRTGVSEGIPEVRWSIGIAPGPPVMVLGGLVEVEVVVGVGVVVGVVGVVEVPGGLEVGFCLSTRWRWRAFWTGRTS